MSRKAREKSSTGVYHVLIRAIADLSLFTDEEDRTIYTGILNDLQQDGRCELYAYALFPTHVHLLIREGALDSAPASGNAAPVPASAPISGNAVPVPDGSPSGSEPIGSIIKRLAASYSYYYNVKYDHYGPIYMDRFKSNPVETRDYYLKVLDHIGSQDCPWKYTCHHIPSGLSNTSPVADAKKSAALLDFRPRPRRVTDSKLLAFLRDNYSFTNIGEFLQRGQEEQNEIIGNCKKIGGSIRQIVRLTGSPYQSVFNVRI